MIDANKRYQQIIVENKQLKKMLETAQRELADSVLSEIQLREEITRLSKQVQKLKNTDNTRD